MNSFITKLAYIINYNLIRELEDFFGIKYIVAFFWCFFTVHIGYRVHLNEGIACSDWFKHFWPKPGMH